SPSTDEYEPSSSDSTDSSLTPEDEPALDDSSALTPSTETGTESVPQEEEEDSTAPSNSSPDPSAASPSADDSSQPSNDVQPTLATRSLAISDIDLDSLDDSFDGSFFDDPTLLLSKRSFVGVGVEGGVTPRFRKTLAAKDAKILKLVALENARRRKALNRARVKFNTRKFNELKFKNDVHLNKDNKAKVVALKDRKNLAEAKLSKVGGGFF
ncbi:uncharacterized protein JCM6883_003520, partial [Sporobolomyces salmoneus]|uniref:uncharacterized protein n=1 Tax=Sporobolomyces salmoneus TaxID=183962 RepID=UPI003173D9B1